MFSVIKKTAAIVILILPASVFAKGVYLEYEEYDEKENKVFYLEYGSTWIDAVYDKNGRVVKEIRKRDNKEITTIYEYDKNGNCILEYTDESDWIRYSYDDRGNVTKEETSDGGTQYREYNEKNLLIKETDEEDEYFYYYDSKNRLEKEVCSDGDEWYYSYNDKNQLIKMDSNYGYFMEKRYDETGKECYYESENKRNGCCEYHENKPVYGKNGLLLKNEFIGYGDQYTSWYTYDEKNQLVHEERIYIKKDFKIENSRINIDFTYDSNGNLILEHRSDGIDYVRKLIYYDNGKLKKYCKYKRNWKDGNWFIKWCSKIKDFLQKQYNFDIQQKKSELY